MKKSTVYSLITSQLLFFIGIPLWLQLTNHLHVLVIGVIWFCVTLITLFIGLLLANRSLFISKRILHMTISLYSVALLVLLFFRPNNQQAQINLVPFETIQLYLSGDTDLMVAFYNIAANIALFIPFGIYYGYITNRRTLMKLTGWSILGISMIELTQYLTARGMLDIDDLILNLTGVIIGFWIFPYIQKTVVITGGEPSDLKR